MSLAAAIVVAGCASGGGEAGGQELQFLSHPVIDVGRQPVEAAVAPPPVEAITTTTTPPPPPDGVLYLTFDDGPSPYTRPVLDVLERHGIKATFFLLGSSVGGQEETVAAIHERGHAIGNHTWSHANLRKESDWGVHEELAKTNEAIAGVTGQRPTCMRPPLGAVSDHVRAGVSALNMSVELWTIESYDWKDAATVDSILEELNAAEDGSVVIMHDGGGDQTVTVQALDQWLTANAGRFDFRTLPDC